MRRFRRSHRSRSGSRRRSEWGGAAYTAANLGSVAAGLMLPDAFWVKVPSGTTNNSTTGLDKEPSDWTLVRSLFSVVQSVRAPNENFYNFSLAAGLIVWESTSDGTIPVTGPNAIPFPSFQQDADWIWQRNDVFGAHLLTTTILATEPPGTEQSWTSRAQRKLSQYQGLAGVVVADNSLGSSDIDEYSYTWYSRHLFKLP